MAQPAGWYSAEGDPEGTTRYWDGSSWQGEPQQAPDDQLRAVAVAVVDPALRVFGRAIDWLLLSLVLVPLWAAGETEGAGLFLRLEYGWIALFGAILFLWDTLWVGLVGATPGKLILGYRVGVAQTFRAPGLRRRRYASDPPVGLLHTLCR